VLYLFFPFIAPPVPVVVQIIIQFDDSPCYRARFGAWLGDVCPSSFSLCPLHYLFTVVMRVHCQLAGPVWMSRVGQTTELYVRALLQKHVIIKCLEKVKCKIKIKIKTHFMRAVSIAIGMTVTSRICVPIHICAYCTYYVCSGQKESLSLDLHTYALS